jgi:hypothetical protein
MTCIRRSTVLAVVLGASVPAAATANAQRASLDDQGRCHYKVENGAVIYGGNGDVYSAQGALLGNEFAECHALKVAAAEQAQPLTCSGYGGPCSVDSDCCVTDDGPAICSWYYGTCLGPDVFYPVQVAGAPVSSCNGTSVQAKFNEMKTEWTVPQAPYLPQNVNQVVLWSGLQGPAGLVQPETWWETNKGDATGYWWYACQIILSDPVDGEQVLNTFPPEPPTSGWQEAYSLDNIVGNMFINAGQTDGKGDQWECKIQDTTQNPDTYYLRLWTGVDSSGNPLVLNTAEPAVLEPHGLKGCRGLPYNSEDDYGYGAFVDNVCQAGTSWSDQVSVEGCIDFSQALLGSGYPNFVSCQYSGEWTDDSANLFWTDPGP